MKQSSYLEWMAKGENLVGADEEKRSKPADSNKWSDTKQKKGKGKVSKGDAAHRDSRVADRVEGKSSKPHKPRYEGKAVLTIYCMVS